MSSSAEQPQEGNPLSNKAILYKAILASAHQAYEVEEYTRCREICLGSLEKPYLGDYARINALHLLALVQHFPASLRSLEEASKMIDTLFERQETPGRKLLLYKQDNDTLMKNEKEMYGEAAEETAKEDGATAGPASGAANSGGDSLGASPTGAMTKPVQSDE